MSNLFEEMILAMLEFFKNLGYFGVLLSLCFEFVPAELVLPLAGYWVSEGDFNYYLIVLAGTVGGTIGPMTLYALGRYGGRPLVLKYGKFFLVKEHHINAADYFFEKYGASVAFFARFMPVVRTAISVPCGIAKMPFWSFTIYTFLAMLPITAAYVYLGMKLGENWEQAGALFKEYTQPIVIAAIVGVIGFILWKYRKHLLRKKAGRN